MIRFSAQLLTPKVPAGSKPAAWSFLVLPAAASGKLGSRELVSVEGTLGGHPFKATLEPDGRGGHWMKVPKSLRAGAGVAAGDTVTLEIEPTDEEPEPAVPADLKRALGAAPEARAAWNAITPKARRDWIHWIVSCKKAETRAKRIEAGCDMLSKGKKRPCCFDRSGMYAKSMGCPEAEDG